MTCARTPGHCASKFKKVTCTARNLLVSHYRTRLFSSFGLFRISYEHPLLLNMRSPPPPPAPKPVLESAKQVIRCSRMFTSLSLENNRVNSFQNRRRKINNTISVQFSEANTPYDYSSPSVTSSKISYASMSSSFSSNSKKFLTPSWPVHSSPVSCSWDAVCSTSSPIPDCCCLSLSAKSAVRRWRISRISLAVPGKHHPSRSRSSSS